MTGQLYSAFSAPQDPNQVSSEFNSAVVIYRERWNAEPPAVHVRDLTKIPPGAFGNIQAVQDEHMPAGLWYFEVEEVMEAD